MQFEIMKKRQHNPKSKAAVVLKFAVMVVLLGYAASYRLVTRNERPVLPCERCDTGTIHPYTIKTLAPVCAACGDLYGPGYEYCCICHETFFEKCVSAAGR
ncbi:uncharacterized protein LOC128229772 [Mya arenaria]|uniref:uncharacterized protein LOC128229772 n=1 Tax=Mya arenaria TaxID=6604 RepID=UPI0022DF6604|nr:uncharacterized protein LOC128229772 [Mya arenaria]